VLNAALRVTRGYLAAAATHDGCRLGECPLGNLIADAIRWYAKTDVVFINAGAIRDSLPAGRVTQANVLALLPFLNSVTRIEDCSGATLLATVVHSLAGLEVSTGRASGSGSSRLLQIGGMRVRWRVAGGQASLQSVHVLRQNSTSGYVALNTSATYSVATPAFIAAGGDG
jgi:2',3'-cyclic-nucleotide 2'-phosphodiesterase (5'-nucleotidase family)